MTAPPRRASDRTGVAILTADDLGEVRRLLAADPVENVFVAARVQRSGVDPARLGCAVWGWRRDGELRALCHAGANLIPVGDPEALPAFAAFAGRHRRCSSIGGRADLAIGLFDALVERWGEDWADAREVRRDQPLMMIDTEPAIDPDPRVRAITPEDAPAYFEASVQMYTEEVGVAPFSADNPAPYRFYVGELIKAGRSFGIVEDGRVVFKADVGSVAEGVLQVQGVWVRPDLRGQGISAPAMAGVVSLARRLGPCVSLYVNHFNLPARRSYERIGMRQVGRLATVLY